MVAPPVTARPLCPPHRSRAAPRAASCWRSPCSARSPAAVYHLSSGSAPQSRSAPFHTSRRMYVSGNHIGSKASSPPPHPIYRRGEPWRRSLRTPYPSRSRPSARPSCPIRSGARIPPSPSARGLGRGGGPCWSCWSTWTPCSSVGPLCWRRCTSWPSDPPALR